MEIPEREYIMTLGKLCLVIAAIVLSAIAPATACEEYKPLSASELKEFRDKLAEKDADPIDRLFAYQELACSDQPVMRSYAIRAGLENAKDPILRQQIAFDALMAMPRIDIELSKDGADDRARQFIANKGSVISNDVRYRNPKLGCIELNIRQSCDEGTSITIKGDTMLYNAFGLVGTLSLTETGEFVGTVRYNGSPMPARIRFY